MELQEKESTIKSKLQWFLFVVLIPFLFAITVALVVLTIAGVNVFDAAKQYGQHIPFVSSIIPGVEPEIDAEDKLREDLIDLEATNQDQQSQITDLKNEVEQKQAEIDTLKTEIEKLNEELLAKEEENQDTTQTKQDLAKIYESMSTKNAAAILTELQDEDALNILRTLSSAKLSAILAKMEPADAARYTELLAINEAE
ncbi:MotE family protein [Bacillus salitolerans]|uniref:MotE family protein n=1 Tax=Bacillus salitolerans TaxID=1437434 RepID=A0ABW4LL35_9BACI